MSGHTCVSDIELAIGDEHQVQSGGKEFYIEVKLLGGSAGRTCWVLFLSLYDLEIV